MNKSIWQTFIQICGTILTRGEYFSNNPYQALTGTYQWYQSCIVVIMETNKERIETLEAGLGGLQDGMHKMELGMADKFSQLERMLSRMSDALFSNKDSTSHNTHECEGNSRNNKDESDGNRLVVSSKTVELQFPKFSSEDPTEWLARVDQFFEFQNTVEA